MRRRRRRRADRLLALGLLAAAAAAVLVASPVHRQYYRALLAPADSGRAVDVLSQRPPAASARVAGVAASRPAAGVDGRVAVSLADPPSVRLPVEGVPRGWRLKEFAGRGWMELAASEIGPALRLRSERASFALYRGLAVDLREYPLLAWSWKVTQLPSGGDVRRAERDDQAMQLYLIFPRWPAPLTESDVLGYVWDTSAPRGVSVPSQKARNVHIVVVESGETRVGSWHRQQRNVWEDYVALFRREPARVGGIALMIDADDTRSVAEAWVGDLAFTRPPS